MRIRSFEAQLFLGHLIERGYRLEAEESGLRVRGPKLDATTEAKIERLAPELLELVRDGEADWTPWLCGGWLN